MSTDPTHYPRLHFWTPLPPMDMRGIGTPFVESLSHYAVRLAWTAGVRNGHLLSQLTGSDADKGARNHFTSLCGPGQNYLRAIGLLEACTGNRDLRHGTFWILHNVLGRTGLNRKPAFRRWCPMCYAEWDDDTSYEPLAWFITLLARCPTHGCDLIDRCPTCGSMQRVVTRYERRRSCTSCAAPLSIGVQRTELPQFMRWVEEQVLELTRLCAEPWQRQVPHHAYATFLSVVKPQILGSGLKQSLMKNVRRIIQRGTRGRVSIRCLISAAALQGVSVRQLLLDPRRAASMPLLDIWHHYDYLPLPRSMAPDKPQRAAHCLSGVLTELAHVYIPPMGAAVLLHFTVVRSVMKEAFPDLYLRYDELYEAQFPSYDRDELRRAFWFSTRVIRQAKKERGGYPDLIEVAPLLDTKFAVGDLITRRVATSAIRCAQLVDEARALPENAFPPLPSTLGWQQTCGVHLL